MYNNNNFRRNGFCSSSNRNTSGRFENDRYENGKYANGRFENDRFENGRYEYGRFENGRSVNGRCANGRFFNENDFEETAEKISEDELIDLLNSRRNGRRNGKCGDNDYDFDPCLIICRGKRGEKGERGERGPAGENGNDAVTTGEMVANSSFEEFTGNIPDNWESIGVDAAVRCETDTDNIHSGKSSVALSDGAILRQIVECAVPEAFHKFSFVACADHNQTCLTAKVDFVTRHKIVNGATIEIQNEALPVTANNFNHYHIVTCKAPEDTTAAIITFYANTQKCKDVYIDDVSLFV